MSLLDVIGLVVVAMLVAFLCRRHEERVCHHPLEDSETGKPFDAASARDRVARVRRDYLALVCARSRDRNCRNRLHTQARQTVRGRSYFRHAASGPSAGQADTEQRRD